jgi:CheY-like chemotaxis protein/ribosomal protein L37AE/L43A
MSSSSTHFWCPSCGADHAVLAHERFGTKAFLCPHCEHVWDENAATGSFPQFNTVGESRTRSVLRARPAVLLVDDDRGFADTLGLLLDYEGFAVTTTSTVAGAAEYMVAGKRDFLITDVRLQHGNGWALAKDARRADPALNVIVVTGFSADSCDGEEEYWGLPVFLKPFDPDDLVAYMRTRASLSMAV